MGSDMSWVPNLHDFIDEREVTQSKRVSSVSFSESQQQTTKTFVPALPCLKDVAKKSIQKTSVPSKQGEPRLATTKQENTTDAKIEEDLANQLDMIKMIRRVIPLDPLLIFS